VAGATYVSRDSIGVGRDHARRLRVAPQAVILVLVLGLVGAMAIEPTRRLLDQRERIKGMAGDLNRVESLNTQLAARIKRLQDPDFIEQEARATAGLVREGETTYVVLPLTHSQRKEQAREESTGRAAPAAEAEPGLIEGWLDFIGLG
jgi:cell division protein FtsB